MARRWGRVDFGEMLEVVVIAPGVQGGSAPTTRAKPGLAARPWRRGMGRLGLVCARTWDGRGVSPTVRPQPSPGAPLAMWRGHGLRTTPATMSHPSVWV